MNRRQRMIDAYRKIAEKAVAPTVDEAAEQGKPKWCPLFELKDWREA